MAKNELTWDVQPYQWITSELIPRYTKAVVIATNNSSKRLAAEAQVWMKANRPWQDRTDAARQGLRVFVGIEKGQAAAARGRMAEARNTDKMLLDQLQEEAKSRVAAGRQRVNELRTFKKGTRRNGVIITQPVLADMRGAINLQRKIKSQRQYKIPTSIPVGRSAVAAEKRLEKGFESPLVDVTFAHGKDVPYAIWLEIAKEGRYSIIPRALAHWTPKFMREIKRIANLKQYQGQLVISDEIVTPEEQFAEHVRKENIFLAGEGRKPYEGWTVERQMNKRANRARFGTEESKAKRKAARAEKKAYLQLLDNR